LRTRSGLDMAVRSLLDSGVNVAPGSDGICSNDTPWMFDVMHAEALLHSISTPDYGTWISAAEALHQHGYRDQLLW
jgi:5-methylthioadenosine/S-adenosylhomocysteine deaminase